MSRTRSVRESVPIVPGDGAETSSTREAESPSFFGHLTDHQLGGIAVFCVVHEHCDEVEFCPIWDWTLSDVLEVAVTCPSCGETRTYRMEGGE
jgi:hypothetical protein